MLRMSFLLIPACLCLTLQPAICNAGEKLSFNRDVRPILADKCYACHGADSAARQADLRLDNRDSAIEMKAILPGNAEGSEMIARIVATSPDSVMPPPELKKSLNKAEIETLKRWVEQGAEYEAHWSFLPPVKTEPPAVSNEKWIKNEIDRFVLKRLEKSGLSPNQEADPRTLFRRIHLDITGLPPKPELIEKFVAEYQADSDAALSRWIDTLMNDPSWGEHRARYWLDAARYGDTHGMHFDNYREMWPYRDWVIRSFNSNQPYDKFTIDQLAGDLLSNPTRDQLVATGFQRCNITTNEGGTIDEENMALYAADRVQTLGWVYMGLTTNCAQCHDHKFDPITAKDYYALAAFFRNTTQGPKDGNVADGGGPVIRVPTPADAPRFEALPNEINTAKDARESRRKAANTDFQSWLAGMSPEGIEKGVPRDTLLLHAPFIEGSGSESLNLCSDTRFKATGEVTWSPDGKLGPAPVMKPGSTFEVGQVGDFEATQKFSVSAWIKPSKDNGTGAVVARMDVAKDHRGWDLWVENRSVGMHIDESWPSSALKVLTEKPVLKADKWTHVAASYDGSGKAAGVKIYIDGKLQKLRTASDTLKPNASIRAETPLRIGQRSIDQIFEGAVQEVRIYGRELLNTEADLLATVQPLVALLKVAGDKRSPEQQELLFKHYLSTADSSYQELDKNLRTLEAELAAIEQRSPVTHIQKEKPNSTPMTNILMRGEYDRVGDQVTAAIPAALPPLPAGAPLNRLGLAQWIVDKSNPLTARVAANRFWSQVFGQGIVVTQEDFGISGAMPTHPELLDWMAITFQENNWDVKRLFKTMLMSATYRQSAQVTPQKLEGDRDNLLISRGPRFRMDAEMVRDYALAASGLLATDMYGPPVKPYQPEGIWDVVGLPEGNTRIYQQSTGKDLYRRSMYTFWKRMAPPPNLEVFNAPSREVCSVKRERTNTPLQALVTLNDVQFFEAARALATRVLNATKNTQPPVRDNAILNSLGAVTLGRAFSNGEQAILLANKDQMLVFFQANPNNAAELLKVGESTVDNSIPADQLATWTMICNQLLNLDEVLNK
jgi:Protein of unknown function (DUF1553)/Protein of unknown function (DUF1549)/Concanavalin A-like lectin/glucanases superfamily/Planctomycete cytochrome C